MFLYFDTLWYVFRCSDSLKIFCSMFKNVLMFWCFDVLIFKYDTLLLFFFFFNILILWYFDISMLNHVRHFRYFNTSLLDSSDVLMLRYFDVLTCLVISFFVFVAAAVATFCSRNQGHRPALGKAWAGGWHHAGVLQRHIGPAQGLIGERRIWHDFDIVATACIISSQDGASLVQVTLDRHRLGRCPRTVVERWVFIMTSLAQKTMEW